MKKTAGAEPAAHASLDGGHVDVAARSPLHIASELAERRAAGASVPDVWPLLAALKAAGWAEAVEAIATRVAASLKDGEGPDDLRAYFRLAAERLALADLGQPQNVELEGRFATLREEVRHYWASNHA